MSATVLDLHDLGPDLDSVPDRAFDPADDLADLRAPGGPLVYAAHSKTTYGTVWAAAHVGRLRALVPEAEVIDPECCGWDSDEDWLGAWPELLRRLSALVVFGDQLGAIGTGCLRELSDAITFGLRVAALDLGLGLCELAGFQLVPGASAARAARLVLGPPLPSLFVSQPIKEEL
jgi:hypothetical protein